MSITSRQTAHPPSLRVDLAGEEWRPVVGYEDLYAVSNLGRVARCRTGWGNPCWKISRPIRMKSGHLKVTISRNRSLRGSTIHRLVAAAFIGPRPIGLVINHKNGDPSDNRPENLEYITQRDNVHHSINVLGRRQGPPRIAVCQRQHEMTAENVQVSGGKRRCRMCIRLRKKRNRALRHGSVAA